jgi:hypothetical protein
LPFGLGALLFLALHFGCFALPLGFGSGLLLAPLLGFLPLSLRRLGARALLAPLLGFLPLSLRRLGARLLQALPLGLGVSLRLTRTFGSRLLLTLPLT